MQAKIYISRHLGKLSPEDYLDLCDVISRVAVKIASKRGRISVELHGVDAGEIRPTKKLCYFVFFSRVRDVIKFPLVKIQID